MGVFPLRYGLFDPAACPGFPRQLQYPFVPMTREMIWEEAEPNYNRLVYADEGERRDARLTRERPEPLFDIIIPIGYNDSVARPGGGSALFIHSARADMGATAGCIAVAADNIMPLIERLRPGMLIDIGFAEISPARVDTDFEAPMETVHFSGLQGGPRLLVTGAVHGNEPCGPDAIWRAILACRAGEIPIRRGAVTFVPVVNGKAYGKGTREGDRNLNRGLREHPVPANHEDRVANQLCRLLREHDVLLDLHSFRAAGEPFVFIGPTGSGDRPGGFSGSQPLRPMGQADREVALALALGPDLILEGWLDAYAQGALERAKRGASASALHGVGTTEYMRFVGNYGVTLECGQHDDPCAPQVAYRAIVRALAHLGIADLSSPSPVSARTIRLTEVVLCVSPQDRLEGAWRTADEVAKGQVIARRASGEAIVAPQDGFVIFPDANAAPLDELFYFGIASRRLRQNDSLEN